MATKKKSIAEQEGFRVIDDIELRNGVENRARQLEAELAGQRAMVEEANADPHDEMSAKTHEERIESIEARLAVVYKRLEHLKSNISEASKDKVEEQTS